MTFVPITLCPLLSWTGFKVIMGRGSPLAILTLIVAIISAQWPPGCPLMMVGDSAEGFLKSMKSRPQKLCCREICRQTGTGGAASNNPNVIHMIPNPKVTSPNQADLGETPAHAFLRRLETGCWRGWCFLPYVS